VVTSDGYESVMTRSGTGSPLSVATQRLSRSRGVAFMALTVRVGGGQLAGTDEQLQAYATRSAAHLTSVSRPWGASPVSCAEERASCVALGRASPVWAALACASRRHAAVCWVESDVCVRCAGLLVTRPRIARVRATTALMSCLAMVLHVQSTVKAQSIVEALQRHSGGGRLART
jgi:hypothetical protein